MEGGTESGTANPARRTNGPSAGGASANGSNREAKGNHEIDALVQGVRRRRAGPDPGGSERLPDLGRRHDAAVGLLPRTQAAILPAGPGLPAGEGTGDDAG